MRHNFILIVFSIVTVVPYYFNQYIIIWHVFRTQKDIKTSVYIWNMIRLPTMFYRREKTWEKLRDRSMMVQIFQWKNSHKFKTHKLIFLDS